MSRRDAAPPPRNTDEALGRARRHALAALAESALALRALVDAASFAATGAPSEAHASLAGAAAWIDGVAEQLQAGAGRRGAAWVDAVARVLDEEIERWETRGRDDPDARAVLRAFLGVREILWEFGLRPSDVGAATDAEPGEGAPQETAAQRRQARREPEPQEARRARAQRRASAARIERVPIEG